MFVDAVEAQMCIYTLTYQLKVGRETSEISPDFVNPHLTQCLDWGKKLYEGSKLQYLGFHLRY